MAFPISPTVGQEHTVGNTIYEWNGSAWDIKSSTTGANFKSYKYTATAGQVSFIAYYTPGYVDVFLNGVKLFDGDFIATNGSTVELTTGALLNDAVEIKAYGIFTLADTYSISQADALLDTKANAATTYSKTEVDNAVAGATMSDSSILSAVKRVDGSGSGLDADTLDGLHSSAFVRKYEFNLGSSVGQRRWIRLWTMTDTDDGVAGELSCGGDYGSANRETYKLQVGTRAGGCSADVFKLNNGGVNDSFDFYKRDIGSSYEIWLQAADYNYSGMTQFIPSADFGVITYQFDSLTTSPPSGMVKFDTHNMYHSGNSTPGKVLQVQQETLTYDTTKTATANTWQVFPDLNITIAASSSSKVLVTGMLRVDINMNGVGFRIKRNGTVLTVGDADGSRPQVLFQVSPQGTDANHTASSVTFEILDDSPVTGNNTYTIEYINEGTVLYINRNKSNTNNSLGYNTRSICTITAMEIAN